MIFRSIRCRPVRRCLAGLLPLLFALAGGCGYTQDVPHLPARADSLGLNAVTNHTETGELDVRLRALLQRRLEQNAHLRLVSAERSTLSLSVDLTRLEIVRVLDPAITSDRSFSYALTGTMTLVDQRSGRPLIAGEIISVQVGRLYAPDVRETPAIRDEGLGDVLADFAEQVERRLFRTF